MAAALARAGFVAPDEESAELMARAAGDAGLLEAMLRRRLTGEPLAWITGSASFCGRRIHIDPGVYVPRPHTEQLARRAVARLPADGSAVDLCTGSGAVARVLMDDRPGARVIATDTDERAVACARENHVDTRLGDLFAPLPAALAGRVDLVVAVVPYVPTAELALLQHDTLAFESRAHYDGGPDGTVILRRVLAESPPFLRSGGALVLELGGGQAELLASDLDRLGFVGVDLLRDEDDDVRGIEATAGE